MFKSFTTFRRIAIVFVVLLFVSVSAIAFEHIVLQPKRDALWEEVVQHAEKYASKNPGVLTEQEIDLYSRKLYWETKEKRGVW